MFIHSTVDGFWLFPVLAITDKMVILVQVF